MGDKVRVVYPNESGVDKIGENDEVLRYINEQKFDVVYSLNCMFGEGNEGFYNKIEAPLFVSTGKFRKLDRKERFPREGILSTEDNSVNWYAAYKKIFENWGLIDEASEYASKWGSAGCRKKAGRKYP